jgi:hypothetical protein
MGLTPETDYLLKELGSNLSGVLGGLPVAEQNQDYFLVFKGVGGTGPEIIDNTAYFVQYIVDSNGNVSKPSKDSIPRLNLLQNFPQGKPVTVRIDNASGINTQLDGDHIVTGLGTQQPILYTQYGIPSSSYTQSISFITPGGAPAGSTVSVSDILGTMIKNSFAFSNSSATTIASYDSTPLTPLEGANFTSGSGRYNITASNVENLNSITFRISYGITGNTSGKSNVQVRLMGEPSTLIYNDAFSAYANAGIIRSFTTTVPYETFSNHGYFFIQALTTLPITFGYLNFEIINTSPNPPARTQTRFWSTGSHTDVTWLTASAYLSLNYGNIQQTSNFPGTGGSFGLSPIKNLFIPQPGDRIRFEYDPSKDYTIYEVISPDIDSEGRLKIKLNTVVPSNTTIDNFILHRVDNTSIKYIILNVAKDSIIDNPENPFTGIILPKYPSEKLQRNLENILSKLKQDGIIEN